MLVNLLNSLPAVCLGVVALVCGIIWWRRRYPPRDPYDLRMLYKEPPQPHGEAWDDMVTEDSGPYCATCDEPHPAGTSLCRHCGRPL